MGIISKIKSVLGVAGDGQERTGERERTAAEPETTSERAVKGVDDDRPSDAGGGTAPDGRASDTSSAAGTDDGDGAPGIDPAAAAGEPVDSIKGIGSAYARRLAEAGVHSVSDLARADPEELAEATDLGAGRVEKWIERARARTE